MGKCIAGACSRILQHDRQYQEHFVSKKLLKIWRARGLMRHIFCKQPLKAHGRLSTITSLYGEKAYSSLALVDECVTGCKRCLALYKEIRKDEAFEKARILHSFRPQKIYDWKLLNDKEILRVLLEHQNEQESLCGFKAFFTIIFGAKPDLASRADLSGVEYSKEEMDFFLSAETRAGRHFLEGLCLYLKQTSAIVCKDFALLLITLYKSVPVEDRNNDKISVFKCAIFLVHRDASQLAPLYGVFKDVISAQDAHPLVLSNIGMFKELKLLQLFHCSILRYSPAIVQQLIKDLDEISLEDLFCNHTDVDLLVVGLHDHLSSEMVASSRESLARLFKAMVFSKLKYFRLDSSVLQRSIIERSWSSFGSLAYYLLYLSLFLDMSVAVRCTHSEELSILQKLSDHEAKVDVHYTNEAIIRIFHELVEIGQLGYDIKKCVSCFNAFFRMRPLAAIEFHRCFNLITVENIELDVDTGHILEYLSKISHFTVIYELYQHALKNHNEYAILRSFKAYRDYLNAKGILNRDVFEVQASTEKGNSESADPSIKKISVVIKPNSERRSSSKEGSHPETFEDFGHSVLPKRSKLFSLSNSFRIEKAMRDYAKNMRHAENENSSMNKKNKGVLIINSTSDEEPINKSGSSEIEIISSSRKGLRSGKIESQNNTLDDASDDSHPINARRCWSKKEEMKGGRTENGFGRPKSPAQSKMTVPRILFERVSSEESPATEDSISRAALADNALTKPRILIPVKNGSNPSKLGTHEKRATQNIQPRISSPAHLPSQTKQGHGSRMKMLPLIKIASKNGVRPADKSVDIFKNISKRLKIPSIKAPDVHDPESGDASLEKRGSCADALGSKPGILGNLDQIRKTAQKIMESTCERSSIFIESKTTAENPVFDSFRGGKGHLLLDAAALESAEPETPQEAPSALNHNPKEAFYTFFDDFLAFSSKRKRISSIPQSFESYDEYFDVFNSLRLEEMQTSIELNIRVDGNQKCICYVSGHEMYLTVEAETFPFTEYDLLYFSSNDEFNIEQALSSLVKQKCIAKNLHIEKSNPRGERLSSDHEQHSPGHFDAEYSPGCSQEPPKLLQKAGFLGIITEINHSQEEGRPGCINTVTVDVGRSLAPLQPNTRLFYKHVETLVTNLREFYGLLNLRGSKMLNYVLDPAFREARPEQPTAETYAAAKRWEDSHRNGTQLTNFGMERKKDPSSFRFSKHQLNGMQGEVVKNCLSSPDKFFLIQGPPGTGKTTVVLSIASALLDGSSFGKKILICTPSNAAIDEIVARLGPAMEAQQSDAFTTPPCIRIGFTPNKSIEKYTIDHLASINKIYHKSRCRQILLSRASVVCSTLSSSVVNYTHGLDFDYLIVDEACQATELNTIIPFKYDFKKIILIGDPMQLSPTVISSNTALEYSFFERLSKEYPVFMLNMQYRMHADICCISSAMFYNNMLVTAPARRHEYSLCPTSFVNIPPGNEEFDRSKSCYNVLEAKVALRIHRFLSKKHKDRLKIAILSP